MSHSNCVVDCSICISLRLKLREPDSCDLVAHASKIFYRNVGLHLQESLALHDLGLADAESCQECEEWLLAEHFELILCDWHNPHRRLLRVPKISHFEAATEEDGIFFSSLVILMFRLDLLQVGAHGTQLVDFDFAPIALT